MTLGPAPIQPDVFRSTTAFCEGRVKPDSLNALLHRECHRLFPDALFADLFTDIGRRSIPPMIVAVLMVLQRLEADHRRHAEVENAIRDLKEGVGLDHLPSGRFAANGAWLAVAVMAHDLGRWTTRVGLDTGIVTTRTLRRRLFGPPGRLTRSARVTTLHLPARWPWAAAFDRALRTLRAIPIAA